MCIIDQWTRSLKEAFSQLQDSCTTWSQEAPVLHLSRSSVASLSHPLIIIILAILTNHIEELQAILALTRTHDPQPIAQLLLLEKLLGQILQVPATEVLMADDLDAAIAQIRNGDVVAQVPRTAFDFNTLLEEGSESGGVEDAVCGRLGGVDDELFPRMELSASVS